MLRTFLELRWTSELIKYGTKISSLIVKNLLFIDSLHFLPKGLNSVPKSFHLTCKKGYYTQLFNRSIIWNMWALVLNTESMGQT